MHIGIDLGNTIVNYDNVFASCLKKRENENVPQRIDKDYVKQRFLAMSNGETEWTRLQGQVYGSYMREAQPSEGVVAFLAQCNKEQVTVSIVSHRTLYPVDGPKINLHKEAYAWLLSNGFFSTRFGISKNNVHIVETQEAKVSVIRALVCTHFVDDHLGVLTHPAFPQATKKFWYTKRNQKETHKGIQNISSFTEFSRYIFPLPL